MVRIWPFAQLNDWADHKRKSREKRTVGTWDCWTDECKPDGVKTGIKHRHVILFKMDGNGLRSVDFESTNYPVLRKHGGALCVRVKWTEHGELPSNVERVDGSPRGKLVSITGGAA